MIVVVLSKQKKQMQYSDPIFYMGPSFRKFSEIGIEIKLIKLIRD